MRTLGSFVALLQLAHGARIAHKRANDTRGCVDLFVIGDFGSSGDKQTRVAEGMARVAESINPVAVLALGDNVYEVGASSEDQMVREWKDVYLSHESLQKPWYAVTGNHDWMINARPMRDFTNSSKNGGFWQMPHFWHSKRWGDVEVFFVDSEIWRGWVPTYWFRIGEQKDWLETHMRNSDAAWKVVVSHHPVWSVGSHGGSGTMKRNLDPIMREHGATIHLAGHDHSQQHIQHENLNYIVSGAGSKDPRSRSDDLPSPDALRHYQGEVGFASLQFCSESEATLKFYTASGSESYSTTLGNVKPSTSGAVVPAVGTARDEAVCDGVEMKNVDLRCSSDGCTVATSIDRATLSCDRYCSAHGLACVGAWQSEFDENCGLDRASSCDALMSHSASQVCRCART